MKLAGFVSTSRLLIIWLLQQAPIASVEGAPTSVSQDASPVSVRLCHRGGLREVSGGLSLARWVHLPSMRARKILRIGEPTALPMRQVSAPDFADIRDHSSPDEDSADPLVLGGVSDDHRQAWRTRPASAASTRSVLLRDRVDDASQTPPSDGECGSGTPARRG
jgi:hypothetical protein